MLTLITATLNAGRYIEQAFASVPIGGTIAIQHIVIDGGSTDTTLDICHRFPAVETIVDELCEKLKIDPLDFRIKNGAKEGTRRADGPVFPKIGMIETAQAAKKHPHYTSPIGPKSGAFSPNGSSAAKHPRGRGVASGFWFNIGLKSSCTASVNADGTGLHAIFTPSGGTYTQLTGAGISALPLLAW